MRLISSGSPAATRLRNGLFSEVGIGMDEYDCSHLFFRVATYICHCGSGFAFILEMGVSSVRTCFTAVCFIFGFLDGKFPNSDARER